MTATVTDGQVIADRLQACLMALKSKVRPTVAGLEQLCIHLRLAAKAALLECGLADCAVDVSTDGVEVEVHVHMPRDVPDIGVTLEL